MPIANPYFNYSNYNYTNPPIIGTSNSINTTAKDFGLRDFLLKKNIGGSALSPSLFYDIKYKGIISPKIGEPWLDTSVNNNTNVIPEFYPIQKFGIYFKNFDNINNNQFKNEKSNAEELVGIINEPKELGGVINNGYSTFTFGTKNFPLAGIPLSYPTKSDNPLIDSYGILAKTTFAEFTKLSTLKNVYSVPDAQKDTSLGIDSQKVNEDFKTSHNGVIDGQGYLDQYGKLNQGGGAGMAAANVLGSVLNGGLGISSLGGGVSTNFDLRSSLVGRILGATGTIDDTNLGKIGGNQLGLALANNAAFNVQQEILGKLNIQDNVLSLIKGNGLAGFRPNYQITVPSSGVGKFFNGAAKILGFTLPRSFISDEGSIFASENGNIENIKRANALLANTGKGQFVSLIKSANANLEGTTQYDNPQDTAFRSGYAPSYAVGDKESEINGDNIYAYSDGKGQLNNVLSYSYDLNGKKSVIPDLNFYREKKTQNSGFEDPESLNLGPKGGKNYFTPTIKQVGFTWTSDIAGSINVIDNNSLITGPKKSLLYKTQELFRSGGMLNLTVAKGNINPFYIEGSQTQTVNGGGISKGSAVLKKEFFDTNGQEQSINVKGDASKVYARAWTTLDRYDKVSKLIRHRGLDEKVPFRHQMQGSVLDDNGFVKIAPYVDVVDDPKKFMFSIENLAWNDQYYNLLPCERGSGDLLTGKKGRIMWFPPYDIQFSENNNVEWESNKFIGRGESVYTYSNTERSGTLSFKVVVDHPTYVNSFSDRRSKVDDNYVASFFAGEIDPSESFSNTMTSYELNEILKEYEPMSLAIDGNYQALLPPNVSLFYYFPNDVYTYYQEYENGTGLLAGKYIAGQLTSKRSYNLGKDYGLNKTFNFNGDDYPDLTSLATAIGEFLNKEGNEGIVVTVKGWASVPGQNTANDELASKRADTIIDIFKTNMGNVKNIDKRIKKIPNKTESDKEIPIGEGCEASDANQDSKACKINRKVDINFEIDYNLLVDKKDVNIKKTARKTTTKNPFYGECGFFEKLKESDDFVFDKFREKIKYFHPAFHSTTPEGLNARLTFLLQCTRQGPTLEQEGANNLAFGRPPVCILRIGDFYNTKIIIDSVSFDYEPLVWDLNPEGIGVQPMIANVNMSFKFIGGSTLLGPINKLQNALSFNYFANTHVYDVRADYLAKVKNPATAKNSGSDYELHNKAHETYNDNLNNGVDVTTIDTPIPEIDQVASSDKATNNIQETPVEEPMFYIGAIIVDEITQDSVAWYLKIKLLAYNSKTYELVTNLMEYNIQTIWAVNDGFTISIREDRQTNFVANSNSTEIYTEKIVDAVIDKTSDFISLQAYLNGATFVVPKKGGYVETTNSKGEKIKNFTSDTIGITDSLGREKFILSVMPNKTHEETARINVKLK
jgi:hypothetical protein